ncbi:MAG: endonuclease/exonuclease/phosphatase family protein [Thermodesulfovibrionales bacterium]
MTYNVHSCIGRDSRVAPLRIAAIIAQYEPDVVALQELDVGRKRTDKVHQAARIAEHLNMDFHFHPSFQIGEEQFGNAILSRLPMRMVKAGTLPGFPHRRHEKRGALWASVSVGGKELQVFTTHLGLHRKERHVQADTLLGPEWASHSCCTAPLVVCGDLNALPFSSVYKRFRGSLRDVQLSHSLARPRNTYPSIYPLARIDHIFSSNEVMVRDLQVPRTRMTSTASDHLPLIVEVSI